MTDTRSLLDKVVIMEATGTDLSDLISPYNDGENLKKNSLTINSVNGQIGYQGKINFDNLKEAEKNFQDPKTGNNYPFAYAKGVSVNGEERTTYNFQQIAFVSEGTGKTKLVGNYFKYQDGDSPSLFTKTGAFGDSIPEDYLVNDGEYLAYEIIKTPITGMCGELNGTTSPNLKPNTNLCLTGISTSLTYDSGTGKWSWICKGKNGGKDSNICSVNSSYTMCNQAGLYTGQVTTYYDGCDTSDFIMCIGEGEGYTLAACNVGTTKAGTGAESYGSIFQWGNNYPFNSTDEYLDASLLNTELVEIPTGTTPSSFSNPYFITSSVLGNWATGDVDTLNNLWGMYTDTNEAKRGPCADGYHMPRRQEMENIAIAGGYVYLSENGRRVNLDEGSGDKIANDLLLTGIQRIPSNSKLQNHSYFWVVNQNTHSWDNKLTEDNGAAWGFFYLPNAIYTFYGNAKNIGHSVRCIKD